MKYLAYLILLSTIIFNVWLNFPETQILADPNDNIFQYSLVYRTNWIWENYDCPLSLSCIPNLFDHLVPTWAEGYPLPYYYTHVPQIAIVGSYHLLIKPFLTLNALRFTLYDYYNLTKYLLLVLFPLPVFIALRIVGFSSLSSAMTAFFASNFSTDGLYGIDPPSFLWRGWGLTSQLYAIFWLPLGLAFTYKSLKHLGGGSPSADEYDSPEMRRSNYTLWAIIFLTLTAMGHLGIGIIGFLSTSVFIFLDLKPRNIWQRIKKLFLVLSSSFLVLSYWLIPILLANNYHIISFWDPLWKFNSYGWYETIRQFFQGEIFDWQRWPIVTGLTLIGFFILLQNPRLFPFAFLLALWFLAYFGRTTWGGLIDLLPGMKDFHLHRFIVGVHIAALFLIAAGLDAILQKLKRIVNSVALAANSKFNPESSSGQNSKLQRKVAWQQRCFTQLKIQNLFIPLLSAIFISTLAYYTVKQTIAYAHFNNKWIGEANNAYRHDEKNFKDLVSYLKTLPPARIYAGRPGNWGKQFRLGSTEMYMLLGVHGFDMSQFLPETWSPLSENEQNFDERALKDYDLLNIAYIVTDKNHDFPQEANLDQKFGPFELYRVPTTGWFDVVTSPMFVKSDKTNFINIVHLWHRGYPRRWKMHPLISVEKKPDVPDGMQRIIEMVDEVSYIELSDKTSLQLSSSRRESLGIKSPLLKGEGKGEVKNIFSDFPFVFPEATVSAHLKKSAKDTSELVPPVDGNPTDGGEIKTEGLSAVISEEKVHKQTYSATFEVPQNCPNCLAIFKMSYHPNWQVELDGRKVEKYAVFPFYLATPVTAGTHVIEFSYYPSRLKTILLVGEILFLALVLLFRHRLAAWF